MVLKLTGKSEENCVTLDDLKTYLRIDHGEEDALLMKFIDTATTWVEEATGQSLLKKTWEYTHKNSCFFLPNPPVTEVLSVKQRGKELTRDKDYKVRDSHGRTSIEVPFKWKQPPLTVQYTAGYEQKDIPQTLLHAVLTTIAYLYENRSCNKIEAPAVTVTPWIQYHRTYHLV